MNTVLRLCFSIAGTFASIGLAALSDQYAEFGRGPARFIMTREELSTWKTVKDDVGAREFIEQFWARRDPAFHVLFDQAVAYADQKLTRKNKRGSLTDMGRVLVIMGQPSRQREYKLSPGRPPLSTDLTDSRGIGTGNVRCWVYGAQLTKLPLGSDVVEVCFDDRYGDGDWLLLQTTFDTGLGSLFERVNRSRLQPPFMTPQDVSSFVQTYYQQPRPELVGALIKALYSTGVTQEPNAFAPLTGFLSEVFAANPARLPEWQDVIARRDRSVKPTLERAAAISKAGGVIAIEGHSASINDLYWGAFFASGRLAFLQKLVDQLRYFDERGDLTLFMAGATSKWSLANNALSHPLVRSTLEAPILKADQRTRDLIRELLAQGPALVKQEIDGVMQRQREAGRWRQSPDPQ
jgi:GWxTD domain-containing protein